MKKILAIAWKDTLGRFTSPMEWIFFLVLPIVFTFVIGGSVGGQGDSRIPILVVDQDGGELAGDLISALEDSQTVRVEQYPLEEAESKFRAREAPAMLIIPTGLEAARASGQPVTLQFTAAAGNIDGVAAEQAVQAVLGAVGRSLQVAGISTAAAEEIQPFENAAARDAYYLAAKEKAQSLFSSQPEMISVTHPAPKGEEQPFWTPSAQASAGQLITWVFIPLLGISGLFAYERTQGTLRRLMSAPVSKAVQMLGTITGQLGTAMIQMLLLASFGVLVMNLGWWRDPPATLVMFLVFGLASVAFGTMLGTFVRTEAQASGVSLAFGMVMAMLSGCWYPRELFPDVVQKAVLALPTTWAMIGMNDILLRGQGLVGVLPTAGVLVGFAAVFFAVGVWRFRYE